MLAVLVNDLLTHVSLVRKTIGAAICVMAATVAPSGYDATRVGGVARAAGPRHTVTVAILLALMSVEVLDNCLV